MDLAGTSEPSTSLKLTPYKPSSTCQICNRPAHGYHHGALTCRACCAFFRRSTEIYHQWKCAKSSNCEITGSGYACKKCRIEKCFRNGMTVENFQINRDAISSSEQSSSLMRTLPMTLERFIGRPHIVIRCEPRSSKVRKTFLDLSLLIDKGSNILSKNYGISTELSSDCALRKLAAQMTAMKKVNIHGNKTYRKLGKKEHLMFYELDFCRTAEWLVHFDEFQKFPISVRMVFLKSIWNLWSIIEKVVLTAENFSKYDYSNTLVLNDSATVDAENLEVDLSWCTDYDSDKIRYFVDISQERLLLKRAVEVLVEFQPDDVEKTFLFLQVCFSYAGRRHQGEILNISEKLLETVSNQMHDYYSTVLKMPHYAGRIAKIMKCDKIVQEYILMRKQKIKISQVFDIFNLQYSHPEMFVDAGY